jgi:predicted S18 family serine protease
VPAKQNIFLFLSMRFSFQQYKQFCSASSSSRLENTKTRMEACVAVEKEIDKILSKFASIRENGSKNIEETIEFLSSIKPELEQGSVNS